MYTKMTPLFDRLVIEMTPVPLKAGKLHVPDSARLPSNEGRVIAAGPGRYEAGHLVPMSVKVDDTVLVMEMRGVDFLVDGKMLKVVEEGAVMAVVERSGLVLES